LQDLFLFGNYLRDVDEVTTVIAAACPTLQRLLLGGNLFATDAAYRRLVEQRMPTLKFLDWEAIVRETEPPVPVEQTSGKKRKPDE
jgi:hypothetical protein